MQIVDKCPECKHGDLDFSFPAYKVKTISKFLNLLLSSNPINYFYGPLRPLLRRRLCLLLGGERAPDAPPPELPFSLPAPGYYWLVAQPPDRAVALDRVPPHRRHHPPHPQGRLQPQLAGVLLWQLKASRKEGLCMHAGGRKGGWDCSSNVVVEAAWWPTHPAPTSHPTRPTLLQVPTEARYPQRHGVGAL